jgi:hypothetical protein
MRESMEWETANMTTSVRPALLSIPESLTDGVIASRRANLQIGADCLKLVLNCVITFLY